MILIKDILDNKIRPFDYNDEKLRKLFSYFLHKAPNIDSIHSEIVDQNKIDIMWNNFILEWKDKNMPYKIYSKNSIFPNENTLRDSYNLSNDSQVSKNTRAFIIFKKDNKEANLNTMLRQLRNAIAHGRVYTRHK